jgi:hypothetical protein
VDIDSFVISGTGILLVVCHVGWGLRENKATESWFANQINL